MRAKMSDRTTRQTSMPAFTAPRSSGRRQHAKAALAEARAILAESEPDIYPLSGFRSTSDPYVNACQHGAHRALAESLAAFCALESL